jgi:hypothetical protein
VALSDTQRDSLLVARAAPVLLVGRRKHDRHGVDCTKSQNRKAEADVPVDIEEQGVLSRNCDALVLTV